MVRIDVLIYDLFMQIQIQTFEHDIHIKNFAHLTFIMSPDIIKKNN